MASKFNYQLTRKANADLDDIVFYIAVELSNPIAASAFLDKLMVAIEEAQSFPESGPQVINNYLPHLIIREKLIDNYIMYYQPDYLNKIIYITRIVYGKRNMDEILTQLNINKPQL